MIFPENISYDYSTFGTVKTAHIYRLEQLIATENSTKWYSILELVRTHRACGAAEPPPKMQAAS